jgi:hypothetical protein
MATWPTTLPDISISGYALSPVDQTVRTDMEGGAPRTRRRTTARNDKLTVAWLMTDAQFAIFRAWFENASTGIAGGAAWFTFSAAIGTTGVVSLEGRFVGPYKTSLAAALIWNVNAELEVR